MTYQKKIARDLLIVAENKALLKADQRNSSKLSPPPASKKEKRSRSSWTRGASFVFMFSVLA
jgi:hypothetical protein